MPDFCTHLHGDQDLRGTKTHVCEECVKMGDTAPGFHLRLCLECGQRGMLRFLEA